MDAKTTEPTPHNRRATDVTAALWAQVTERSRESAVHGLVVAMLTPYLSSADMWRQRAADETLLTESSR